MLLRAVSNAAVSATVLVIGPAVSWLMAIGTIPVRLIRPIVGFRPTSEVGAEGLRIEPDVSVPTVSVARPAAAAEPEPELDPLGVWDTSYGLRPWPPNELYPPGMPS